MASGSCSTPGLLPPPSSSFDPFDLSSGPPPRLQLSKEQLNRCSEALAFFRKKFRSPATISREFDRLQEMRFRKDELIGKCTVALQIVNLEKNRHFDILPFDYSRVVLKSIKDHKSMESGYINASFIKTPSNGHASEFIATQGPLPETCKDFWNMVIQYHCPVIVMLTVVDGPRNTDSPSKYSPHHARILTARAAETSHKSVGPPPMRVLPLPSRSGRHGNLIS